MHARIVSNPSSFLPYTFVPLSSPPEVAWMDGEGAHMMSNATQLLGQASQLQTDAAALQQDILQMRAWLNSLVMAGGEVELLVHAGFLGDSYRNAKVCASFTPPSLLSIHCQPLLVQILRQNRPPGAALLRSPFL